MLLKWVFHRTLIFASVAISPVSCSVDTVKGDRTTGAGSTLALLTLGPELCANSVVVKDTNVAERTLASEEFIGKDEA
jgi:hypothetical protein